MTNRKSKKLKLWDFEFIGTTTSDPAGRAFAGSDAFPNYVANLEEVASYVFRVCLGTKSVAGRVSIAAHGNTEEFHVGNDRISLQNIDSYATSFKKLGLLMLPGISVLELYSCQVGQNKALLRRLSQMIGGAAVVGYEQNQPGSGRSAGRRIKCKLKCKTFKPRKRRRKRGSTKRSW